MCARNNVVVVLDSEGTSVDNKGSTSPREDRDFFTVMTANRDITGCCYLNENPMRSMHK
jgi:hypothetical protein